jgi:branched-subunit amino acid aminotransferase/4-amino-4-deoxychorismate lyase
MVTPVQPLAAKYYQRGAAVVTVEVARYLPEVKSINYLPGIRAQQQALKINPESIEAIYRVNGRVVEGTRSNTFIFKSGRWITPADELLLGITRAQVIKLIEAEGELEYRNISLDEYYGADEIVITSSTKEVIPVVRVDAVTIGSGEPGENSRRLMRQWRELTESYAAADGYQ